VIEVDGCFRHVPRPRLGGDVSVALGDVVAVAEWFGDEGRWRRQDENTAESNTAGYQNIHSPNTFRADTRRFPSDTDPTKEMEIDVVRISAD
jgi:hypothetical protein